VIRNDGRRAPAAPRRRPRNTAPPRVRLADRNARPRSNPAEIGTLVLEFGTLARLTNKPIFFDKAKNALVQLFRRRSKLGLVGEEIDVETGNG